MSDMFEIWSLPWHAMQRRLAKGVGAEAAARTATNPRDAGARVAAAPASSWLARALSRAPTAAPLQVHR
jgi:hypothetical protein